MQFVVFSDRNIEWMEWIGKIQVFGKIIRFLARNLQCNLDMYIILMFQVCHFHYWVAKCIKSDRYRSTAGWSHIQLSSLVQRQNFISALLDCQPGNEEVQNKNLPWEIFFIFYFFTKLCISLGKKHINGKNSVSRQSYGCIFHHCLRSFFTAIFPCFFQLPVVSMERRDYHRLLQGWDRLVRF